ncbi:MAG TPA: hypothetical protein PLM89_10945, partial [Anaerolineales bacterium]|nr:hypothetical protein [Anaerolineales bacterium]
MRITKISRDLYGFSSDFFDDDGDIYFRDFASARELTAQINALRSYPLPASELYALALVDEALRALVRRFAPPPVMNTAVNSASEQVGADSIDRTQKKFVAEFPPESVYLGEQQVDEYLAKLTNGRVKSVEELIYVFT